MKKNYLKMITNPQVQMKMKEKMLMLEM